MPLDRAERIVALHFLALGPRDHYLLAEMFAGPPTVSADEAREIRAFAAGVA